jgi:hypothetical protein
MEYVDYPILIRNNTRPGSCLTFVVAGCPRSRLLHLSCTNDLQTIMYDGPPRRHDRRPTFKALTWLLGAAVAWYIVLAGSRATSNTYTAPAHAAQTLARCSSLHTIPGPPNDFHKRKTSDRFVPGTKPVLLRNANIWTVRRQRAWLVHGMT